MPSYDGLLADPSAGLGQEEALLRLIAYLRTLGPGQTPPRTDEFPPPEAAPEAKEGKR
jgi:hypothetical protein